MSRSRTRRRTPRVRSRSTLAAPARRMPSLWVARHARERRATGGVSVFGVQACSLFVLDSAGFRQFVVTATNFWFSIAFDPSTVGAKVANVTFTHTATNTSSPFQVNVSGTGTAGAIIEVRET